MDPHRFDHLARGLAEAGWTRRGVASALTGSMLAVFGGRFAPDADAKKRKGKKNPAAGRVGLHAEARKGGKKPKKCKNGTVKCGKKCVNRQTNPLHCGGCGRRCGSGIACVDGECQGGGCLENQILCGGRCVDPEEDEQHCGGCNAPCPGGHHCRLGECVCPGSSVSCLRPGHACCDGGCVNLDVINSHCGACFNQCSTGTSCCSGSCVDTFTDARHCGMCGRMCESGEICCEFCRDPDSLLTDGDHCGACRNSCRDILPEAGVGACCGGSCVDLQVDLNNCGECDNVCETGEECQSRGASNPPAECIPVAGGGGE